MQVVVAVVAGFLIPQVALVVQAVVVLVVVPLVSTEQTVPTGLAAVAAVGLIVLQQRVEAVRALSLCVTQTCPLFRANPRHARCRLEYQPLLQLLLQQRAQRFRTSGKKMVLIFRVQHRRATPLPHQL